MQIPRFAFPGAATSVAALALLGLAASAHAHITLEQKTADAGSTYKAVFRVGHGCDGSATRAIVVTLPAGVEHAHPMPKPGWTVEVAPNAQGLTQIAWRGGPLADAHYDEFVLRAQLPAQAGPLWWPVLQQCERGENHWAAVPASGTDTKGVKLPAALLDVRPVAAPAGHAHH